MSQTESASWDPNEYQGRTQEQLEANAQVLEWIAGIALGAIAGGLGYWIGSGINSLLS